MNKTSLYAISGVLIILVGGVAFFGGMKYGQGKCSSFGPQSFMQRQGQNGGQFGQGNRMGGARGNGGTFVNGQIISKDDKSITVKSPDGGSKIVFFGNNAQIVKAASGTVSDLINDTQVVVTGQSNSDGSITAKNIQIRPEMPSPQPPVQN